MTEECMEELFKTSDRLIGEVSMGFRRALDIDWRDRLVCITGRVARARRRLCGSASAKRSASAARRLST